MADPNPFARFGVSDKELAEALRNSVEVDAALQEFMEDEVVPYWKSVAPVDSGKYAASVKVTRKAKGGRGVVTATDWKAHFIEYGTAAPGPTTAFAPAEKTAIHFGGTLQGGITAEDDGE